MTDPERDAGASAAVTAFIDKWHAREPEMAYAEVFCPRPLRLQFALWGALLFELREAAFELSDVRLLEVKSVWWADELLHCAQAAPQHPLTQALAAPRLPWNALARGMHAMAQRDASLPADRDAAIASVAPLADGIASVEAALFDASNTDAASRAAGIHLLGERLRIGSAAADGGCVPLSLLARHGTTRSALAQPQGEPVVADWADALIAAQPSEFTGMDLYRSARTAFDGWFLHELAAHRPQRAMPRLRALRLAWSAARRTHAADAIPKPRVKQ
ncbi:MAG: hypothetical protein ABIT64_04155 [Lysobacteraceae bacterium]